MDCWNLKRIELPRGLKILRLKILGPYAFMGCDAVETIVIHEDVDFSCSKIFVGHEEWDEYSKPYFYQNWKPDSIVYLAMNPKQAPDIFQDVMYK
ncbi:MAG: hypothetical protein K2G67_01590 [Muribaculaceae bacterium]|nr:hypothetical protein [Muribaculaceae bacterium]